MFLCNFVIGPVNIELTAGSSCSLFLNTCWLMPFNVTFLSLVVPTPCLIEFDCEHLVFEVDQYLTDWGCHGCLQNPVRSGIIDPDTRVTDHGRETVRGRVSLLQPISQYHIGEQGHLLPNNILRH